jgi:hypothetical protein
MALRIAPKGFKPQEEEPDVQAPTSEAPPTAEDVPPVLEGGPAPEEAALPQEMPLDFESDPMAADGGGVVDPMTAGYRGPDMGPFMCGNCQYFNGDNTCQLVAGEIDPMGICNLFTAPPMEQEEPLPEEAGMEPPVEEPMAEPVEEEAPVA